MSHPTLIRRAHGPAVALAVLALLLAALVRPAPASAAAAPCPASTTFATKVDFTVGSHPQSVALGDLNGDGKPDLATANEVSNSVSVLLNTTAPGAAPTFATTVAFPVGTSPNSVALGDLNGDGRPDLATANEVSNSVSVLLNTTAPGAASATFAAAQNFIVGFGPQSVALGDLNGDGKPDLATANYDDNTVSVLLNTTAPGAATPAFALKVDFTVGTYPRSVALGDLNGDGRPDLAVANANSNNASVLLNTTAPGAATPEFTTKVDFTVGTYPRSVALGDLNGDGRPDLAVANANSNNASVLLNTSAPGAATPAFATAQNFAVGYTPSSVAVGDLNGDGRPDLAVANANSSNVSVLLNTTAPGAASATFAGAQPFAVGLNPRRVAVGDLNGDGRPDLATANANSHNVSVLLNTGTVGTPRTFAPRPDISANMASSVAVGDLNGDGKPDLAAANYGNGTVSVRLNTTASGATSATFAAAQTFAVGTYPRRVAVGDLNGDGKPDLATANALGSVSVRLNTTAPGAASATFATLKSFTVGSEPRSVAVGDLNGDGKPDLATANYSGNSVSVLLNTTALGAATPAFALKVDFAVGIGPYSVALGDLNGDGRPDLAVANYSGHSVSVLLNTTAPGAATPAFTTKVDFPVGTYPSSVALGDLNGDGKPDLATANEVSNNVSVLLNTTAPGTSATFATKVDFTVGDTPSSVALGDLNGDGKPDLAVANANSNNVSVLLNTTAPGAATPEFTTKVDFAVGAGPYSVALGNLNGDGMPDLATANYSGNSVSVLANLPLLTLAATGGDGQSTAPNNAFAQALAVTVSDSCANPVAGVTVTFSAPGSGASGTFPGPATSATATTDGSGVAIAPAFTANTTPGSYSVSATAPGVSAPAQFSLTNVIPLPTVSISAPTATAAEGGAAGVFTIARSGDTSDALAVTLAVDAASDAAASDYALSVAAPAALSGDHTGGYTVTIPAGVSAVDVTLSALADGPGAEPAEALTLDVQADPAYVVGSPAGASVTIAANDTTVTTTGDSGAGSLRQALLNANAFAGADTISFSLGAEPHTITLLTALPNLAAQPLTIAGPGAELLTVRRDAAAPAFRILTIPGSADVTVRGLTLSGGNATDGDASTAGWFDWGGAIYNDGALTLERVTLAGNQVERGGGAIFSSGLLTVRDSTISSNSAIQGSAINVQNSVATVVGVTISGNSASLGSIVSLAGSADATTVIQHTTIVGNTDGHAAVLQVALGSSTVTTYVDHTIVAANAAPAQLSNAGGGGIERFDGSGGSNLLGSPSSILGVPGLGNQFDVADPRLGPLQDNGGPTWTMAPLPDSPALNAGDPAFDPNAFTPPLTTDQTGSPRQFNDGRIDIGAVEAQFPVVASVTRADPSPTSAAQVAFTVTFSDDVAGVESGDFDLRTTGGQSGATIATVTPVNARTYTVVVNTVAGEAGTITLDVRDDDTIRTTGGSQADVPLGGVGPGNGKLAGGPEQTYTIDRAGPTVAVTAPANGGAFRAATWPGAVGGTAGDLDSSLAEVAVSIRQHSSGQYWDGDGFDSSTELFVPASGTTAWSLAFAGASLSDGQYTVVARATDAVGNTADSTPVGFTYDATAPTVAVALASGQANPTTTAPIAFTVTFSEPVVGFVTGDLTPTGTAGATSADITEVAPLDGTTYRVTVSGMTAAGSVTLAVPAAVAADDAGNGNAAATADATVQFTPAAPVVTGLDRLDPSPTSATSVRYRLSFSEPVDGVDLGDLVLTSALTGAAIDPTIAGGPQVYTITVAAGSLAEEGTIRLDLADDDSITSVGSGLRLGGLGADDGDYTGQVYDVDRTPLTLTVALADGQADPATAEPVQFAVTFGKPVTGFAADDLVLSGPASAGATASVSGGPQAYTVSVSGMAAVGDLSLSVLAGAAQDAAGNPSAAGEATLAYHDVTAPSATLVAAADVTVGGSSATIVVAYHDGIGVAGGSLGGDDLVVTGPAGTLAAELVSVDAAGDGPARTATYSVAAPGGAWGLGHLGSYTIALAGDAVHDTSGNAAAPTVLGQLRVAGYRVYLPALGQRSPAVAPDLVVTAVRAAGEQVQVTIRNDGTVPVSTPFWVDVYIAPRMAPTGVNQIWDVLGTRGLAWGVTTPLAPGEVRVLTIGDGFYHAALSRLGGPIAVGTPIYAQVDSAAVGSAHGGVLESHEIAGGAYNNITAGVAEAGPLPAAVAPAATTSTGALPAR